MKITTKDFGTIDGKNIHLYTLENDNGIKLSCTNFGCIVTEILTPGKNGQLENIVLGFDNIDDYLNHKTYFGAVVGRVAGRIKAGSFELGGKNIELSKNEGNNHLHGGIKGFNEKVWDADPFREENGVGIHFTYLSEDGEEGYPGNVQLTVSYLLTNDNQWIFTCKGTTDQKTALNITNHTYFNLTGNAKDTILNHELSMKSDHILELNQQLLPTGDLLKVDNTAFDFRSGRKIESGVVSREPLILLAGNGYDHPFVLSENMNEEIVLMDEVSGRKLTVETNQPCVILYTSNRFSGDFFLKNHVKPQNYLGLCLETQGYPDAVNHKHFPSIILFPGDVYQAMTVYTFE